MSKRITLVMNDTNLKKVKKRQARELLQEDGSVSFSRVVNDMLEEAKS